MFGIRPLQYLHCDSKGQRIAPIYNDERQCPEKRWTPRNLETIVVF